MSAGLLITITWVAAIASVFGVPFSGLVTLIVGALAIRASHIEGETRYLVSAVIGIALFLVSFGVKLYVASQAYDSIRERAIELRDQQQGKAEQGSGQQTSAPTEIKPEQFSGEPTLEAIYSILKQDLPQKGKKIVKALAGIEDFELFLTTCDKCLSSDDELVRSTALFTSEAMAGFLMQGYLVQDDPTDNYSDEEINKVVGYEWQNEIILEKVAKDESYAKERFPTFIKVTDEIVKEKVEAINKRHTK